MAVPLTNYHSVPYHRIDCITVPLTFGIRQDAMLLSPVATDIRFCNLTLYNGLVGLRLNKILQHKEMMFSAPRGLGRSQSPQSSQRVWALQEGPFLQAFRVGDLLLEEPGARVLLVELPVAFGVAQQDLLYKV